jgi:Tfp pilus assembly protein PilO
MKRIVLHRNAIVRWGLAVSLLADVVLLGLNLKLDRSPHVQATDLNRLAMLEKSYRADNTRLERFRRELPADEKQWNEFFTANFQPYKAAYSAISSDLGELSRAAGLHSDEITFNQHTPDARGLMEVEIATAVEGDYDSLIQFLDKLEHSNNFYVLDSLTLTSSSAGKLRLNVHLRTYFRTT